MKDLRRDAWLTETSQHPLPLPAHLATGRPKGELREILQEAVVQLRGGRALEEATQRRKGERRGPSVAHRRAPRTVHTTAASVPSLLPSRSHWQAVSRRE